MTSPSKEHLPAARAGKKYTLHLAAALVFVSVAVYWSFPGTGKPARPQSGADAGRKGAPANAPVTVASAYRGDVPVHLDGLGTVTALNTVVIRSRVDGELQRVHFSEGQPVRKGDLLAEIDPRPYEAQLAQAQGQLARDQALLDNARADLQRYQVLLQQDSIAAQQVTGQAALVRQYEAAARVDKGQIAAIRLQLDYCRITAPVSGRAGLRVVDPGNVVHANDANGLVVISQTQPIATVFTLPEDQLPQVMGQLKDGRTLVTEAYDRSGSHRLASGTLLAVDNQIDPATGTVKLKAVFPNEDGMLFANQFVNVRMNLEPLRDATIIPAAAVQRGAQGDFAYVVNADGKVRLQTLRLGPAEGDRVAVLEGLSSGAQVVVEGTDRLRDGMAVEVVNAPGGHRDTRSLVSADPLAPTRPSDERRERRQ